MSETWIDAVAVFETQEAAAVWADAFRKVENGEWRKVEKKLNRLGLLKIDEEIEWGFEITHVYHFQRRVDFTFREGNKNAEDILKKLISAGASHLKATLDNSQTGTQWTFCRIGSKRVKPETFVKAVSEFDDQYAFFQALTKGNIAEMEKLISKGVDPKEPFAPNWYPIHVATYSNKKAAVSLLIEAGVDINVQTADHSGISRYHRKRTPLSIAVCENRKPLVKMLLKSGADYSLKNGNGETPLQEAISHQDKEICQLLIKAGADPNENTPRGEPAFFDLLVTDYDKLIEFLLFLEKNGADINSNSEKGANLRWVYGSSPAIREFFANRDIGIRRPENAYCGELPQDLLTSIRHCDLEKFDEFLAEDFDINKPVTLYPGREESILLEAVRQNDTEMAERLLDAGVDINAGSVVYESPLILAATKGYKEMLELLVGRGAEVNAEKGKAKRRQTPDDPVLKALSKKYTHIAKFLLDKWEPNKSRLKLGISLAEKTGDENLLDRIRGISPVE